MMPQGVIDIRMAICRKKKCPHALDYTDPLASCPEGHWGPHSNVKREFPPLATQVKSYAVSTIRHVAAMMPQRTPEQVESIVFDFCHKCEFLKDERCLKCGCPVRRKAVRELEHCPVGKW